MVEHKPSDADVTKGLQAGELHANTIRQIMYVKILATQENYR